MEQNKTPYNGSVATRSDVINYIFSRGKISQRQIFKKFNDINTITLNINILKTWWIYKNEGYKGRYISSENGYCLVVNG